jgi:hypothetical protein
MFSKSFITATLLVALLVPSSLLAAPVPDPASVEMLEAREPLLQTQRTRKTQSAAPKSFKLPQRNPFMSPGIISGTVFTRDVAVELEDRAPLLKTQTRPFNPAAFQPPLSISAISPGTISRKVRPRDVTVELEGRGPSFWKLLRDTPPFDPFAGKRKGVKPRGYYDDEE